MDSNMAAGFEMIMEMIKTNQLSFEDEIRLRDLIQERENRRKEKRIAYDLLGLLQREVRHERDAGRIMLPEKQFWDDILDSFGEVLYLARNRAGMTQSQLAVAAGLDRGSISRIERGILNPTLATIKRLADGLGMRLDIGFL